MMGWGEDGNGNGRDGDGDDRVGPDTRSDRMPEIPRKLSCRKDIAILLAKSGNATLQSNTDRSHRY